ncbi:hypothetical protein [Staphylococcus marylandisciuri]|uniref:hypothetical protein n=1 Tax=Staphylococcus marylandisciuri TaxID=2981529 RepID=UPI0021D2AA2F|nr:hypothetical protein [Staphylococcus marylandisciuri]
MTKRYIKVLVLYIISTFFPTLVTCKLDTKPLLRWLLVTSLGYVIFAYGLYLLSKLNEQNIDSGS